MDEERDHHRRNSLLWSTCFLIPASHFSTALQDVAAFQLVASVERQGRTNPRRSYCGDIRRTSVVY